MAIIEETELPPLEAPIGAVPEVEINKYKTIVASEKAAMSKAVTSGLDDIEALKRSLEDGTFDPSKSLGDIVDPPDHPFAGLGDDPSLLAQRAIASSILSQETTEDNRYLKELLADGELGVLPGLIRYSQNVEAMNEILLQRLASVSEDRGYAEILYDGIDWFLLRGLTLSWYEDLTKYSERFGTSVMDAVVTMDPTEFNSFMVGVVDEIDREGIISWDNPNAITQRLSEATKLGFDLDAEALQAMALGDILLGAAGSPLVRGVSKTTLGVLKAIPLSVARGKNPIAQILGHPKAPPSTVKKAVQAATPPAKVPNASAQAATHPSTLTGAPNSPGHSGVIQLIQEQNRFVRKWLKDLPRITDDVEVQTVLATRMSHLNSLIGRQVLRSEVVQRNFDQFATVIEFGTKTKGAPYIKEAQAVKEVEKLRKNLDEALDLKVVPLDEGFVIRATQDVLEKDIPRSIQSPPSGLIDKITGGYLWRYLGSTRGNDDWNLAAMFNQREASLAKYIKDNEPVLQNAKRAVGKKDAGIIDEIIDEIWNGPNSTNSKVWWDRPVLEAEYLTRTGSPLPDTAWNYYSTFRDLSDLAAYAKASSTLKRMVELGYTNLKASNWNRNFTGRAVHKDATGRFSSLTRDDSVLNLGAKPGSGAKNLWVDPKKAKVIYRLDEPVEINGRAVKYVANPDEVNLLGLDDVFGYNAGPTRTNPRARYFIVNTSSQGFSPRAFLTASSKSEARRAVASVETLRVAEKNKTLTDNLVQANNDWNPNIRTVQDWKDFSSAFGLGKGRINWKARDQEVFADRDFSEIWSSESTMSYLGSKQRGDVLTHYGGEATYNTDPFTALAKDLSSSLNKLAYNAQTMKTKRAFGELLKAKVSELGEGFKLPDGMVTKTPDGDIRLGQIHDINRLVEETKITGKSTEHNKLRDLQQAIFNRSAKPSFFENLLKVHGNELMEKLYDKTNREFFKRQIVSGDALTKAILSWNFHTTLGMFSFDQLFVQGFSAVTAAAISPRHGISAVASQPLFHLMVSTGNMEVRKGVAKVLEKLSYSTTSPITADVWLEAADYYMKSGRNIVEHTAMELGTGASMRLGPKGWRSGLQNTLHVAAFPFRAGERVARSASIIIAHADFKKAFPNASFKDSMSQRWIVDREQNLVLNMNTGSHSAVQRGFLRIPLQWTSYMFRVAEAMTSGGRMNLTAAERARLAGFLTVGMGVGAFGVDGAAEGITEWLGYDPGPDQDVYRMVQGGIVDGLLNLGGLEVSLSDRLSFVKGLRDFYHNWADAEGLEAVGNIALGPTLTVFTKDALQAMDASWDLLSGRESTFDQEFLSLIRTVKGADNVMAALGVMQHGFKKGRTGKVAQIGEVSPVQAGMYLLGLKPWEEAELARKTDALIRHKRDLKDLNNYYRKKFRNARNYAYEGDMKAYFKMIREIQHEINTEANLSDRERMSLRSLLTSPERDEKGDLLEHWLEHGEMSTIRGFNRE